MSTRLDVRHLSFDTNELELRELFGRSGQVVDATRVAEQETGW